MLVEISINKSGVNSEFQEEAEKRMNELLNDEKFLIMALKKNKKNMPNWLKKELLKRAKKIMDKK